MTGGPSSCELRRVVLVSPQFPPCSLAAVHRVRHLSKYLPDFGWEPSVVCVHERHYTAPLDHRLSGLLDPACRQVKVQALPKEISTRFGVSDVGLRAFGSLKRAVLREIRERDAKVVFITGFPFYPMMMAKDVRRAGARLVLDFQDPWVSNWGASQPALSKAGLAHRIAAILEPRALRYANAVMSVSETQNDELRSRYPWLSSRPFIALPIGGDWGDYDQMRDHDPNIVNVSRAHRNVNYVGSFAPRAGELFRVLFQAIANLRAAKPQLFEAVRFNFVGTNAFSGTGVRPLVLPFAVDAGVADLVHEQPGRVPYLDALALMKQAHALTLIGSDERHYTASKVFPALMAQRPFLSIFHRESSAHDILTRAGGGRALAFENPATLAGLRPQIVAALDQILTSPSPFGMNDPSVLEPYSARSLAKRCAGLFDQIAPQGES
jgi:hypothetical protein